MSFYKIILRMALVGAITMFILLSLTGCNANHCTQRFTPEDVRYQCLNCWVVAYIDGQATYWYTTDRRYHALREWKRRTGHHLDTIPLDRHGFKAWSDGHFYHITQTIREKK